MKDEIKSIVTIIEEVCEDICKNYCEYRNTIDDYTNILKVGKMEVFMTPKSFNGKEYTLYEAKQRQRQMETCMRAQREKVELLKKEDCHETF